MDNGVLICWKTVRETVACTTAWGGCYESQVINLGNYPYSFKSGSSMSVSLTAVGINATFEGLTENSISAVGKVRMWRPTSASQTGNISVLAIGIWK